jgi:hypothetical protein
MIIPPPFSFPEVGGQRSEVREADLRHFRRLTSDFGPPLSGFRLSPRRFHTIG